MEKPAEERRDAATVINGVMDGWVASALFADKEASGIKTALQEAPGTTIGPLTNLGARSKPAARHLFQ